MESLLRAHKWGVPSLHILITSRWESHIESGLFPQPTTDATLGDYKESSRGHSVSIDLQAIRGFVPKDIEIHLDKELMKRSWDPDIKADVRSTLLNKKADWK